MSMWPDRFYTPTWARATSTWAVSSSLTKRSTHSDGEYVRGRPGQRHHEPGRGLLLTAQAVARRYVPPRQRQHLPRYLAEFDFRYSTRKMSDTNRMEQLVGQTAGRRFDVPSDPLGGINSNDVYQSGYIH